MNQLNSILIEGNLTKDPDLNSTKSGTSVCNFSLASNRYYKKNGEGQNEVSFFDVETWSKLAENCGEYLKKGRGVRVVGRLKQDRWVDTEGKTRTKVKIVAEHVEFKPDFKNRSEDKSDGDEKLTERDFFDPELDEKEVIEREAV
jgi:single-strand DNA-binding protein